MKIKKYAKAVCCTLIVLLICSSPVVYEELFGTNADIGLLGFAAGSVLANEESAVSAKEAKSTETPKSALADSSLTMSTVSVYKPPAASGSVISSGGTVTVTNEQLAYSTAVSVTATAYCSCYQCCAPYDGTTTASGTSPRAYHTIAASKSYSFGTKVYIPYFENAANGGMFVVEDRGGAITGNRIDIYFNSHAEALRFGRRTLTMYVLK